MTVARHARVSKEKACLEAYDSAVFDSKNNSEQKTSRSTKRSGFVNSKHPSSTLKRRFGQFMKVPGVTPSAMLHGTFTRGEIEEPKHTFAFEISLRPGTLAQPVDFDDSARKVCYPQRGRIVVAIRSIFDYMTRDIEGKCHRRVRFFPEIRD